MKQNERRLTARNWKVLAALILALLAFLPVASAQGDSVLRVRARAGADIQTMDPAHYLGNDENNIDLALYCKLIAFEPRSTETALDAAESLEVNEDGTVLEFKLREGMQFHHGYGEVTAEDVKFSFERIIDPATNSGYAQEWRTLEEVEVTGKYTGRIILSEPYAPLFVSTLPWNAGSIISKAAYEEKGERFATDPVGCGPYYWSEWRPNQMVVLERFEDYYGDKPDFQRIEILPLTESQVAELAFDRDELDETGVALDSVTRYENIPGVTVTILPTLRYHWLGFNMQEPPFDDIRVREAVRYVIDVDEIVAGAYSGVPERANAMLAPGMLGYWEDAPAYQPDLERAKQLMAEAGYADGFATTLTHRADQDLDLASLIAQQQLAQLGIQVELITVPTLFDALGEKSVPGLHVESFSGVLDPGYWFNWFTCDQVGKWNYWKWCNEEADLIHGEAAVTVDTDERAEMYVKIQQLMDEDITAVWFTNGARVQVYREAELEPAFMTMYRQYQFYRDLTLDDQ